MHLETLECPLTTILGSISFTRRKSLVLKSVTWTKSIVLLGCSTESWPNPQVAGSSATKSPMQIWHLSHGIRCWLVSSRRHSKTSGTLPNTHTTRNGSSRCLHVHQLRRFWRSRRSLLQGQLRHLGAKFVILPRISCW